MAPERPPWVIKDLTSILGLDEESVKGLVVPDLESYTHEARLRGHLQDFLGSSPQAKAFTTRYISHRFPSLATSSTHSVTLTPDPSLDKTHSSSGVNRQGKSKSSVSQKGSGTHTPSIRFGGTDPGPDPSSGGNSIPEALNAAFGPGGKIYQKNRDYIEDSWGGRAGGRSTSSGGISRGGAGSGTVTPSHSHSHSHGGIPRQRQAGAVTVQVQNRTAARIDGSGSSTPLGTMGSRTPSGKGKGRGGGTGVTEKIWDRPKSKEVKRLEGMIEDLRKVKDGDGKVRASGGDQVYECFCQARVHELSTYTPLCQSCGLTICSLHPPHLPCPSCAHPLSSPTQLARLILRLENEIEAQEAREDKIRQDRERARLERLAAEAGGGSFPTLPGGGGGSGSGLQGKGNPQNGSGAVGGTRKVLTIGSSSGKGKSTITTTTYRPVPIDVSSSSASTSTDPSIPPPPTDLVSRPRSNPVEGNKMEKELGKLLKWREEQDRPWGDLRAERKGDDAECWRYVELQVVAVAPEREGEVGRRRKSKMKRGEGGREVPGAG
ncbi:hypothetical protein IAR55_000458 [Kwoniella newhampshirensis]|uniref:TRIP4/RQT4 C2HC5-type zinc finger domain-containing protein n=1 Tax=Kwoniella newhampshirensis TaxID=1651941 RepID=A0AAW0Z6S1_9TREE